MTLLGPPPLLTDGTVTLRQPHETDVEACWEQNQDALSRRWTTAPWPYTREDATTYLRHILPAGWESEREWSFVLAAVPEATDGTDRYAGILSLRHLGHGRAEVAFGAHPWARGTGLVERGLRLLLQWGFEDRDLASVVWLARRGNWASRRLAWRLGFGVEGTLRDWLETGEGLTDAWAGTLRRGEELAPRHPWYDAPELLGDDVRLRPLADADLPRMLECLQDEQMRHFNEGPRERAPHTAERWPHLVDERREWAARGEAVSWTVTAPGEDRHLGLVQLFRIAHRRQAELGFWSHPDARGRGTTTRAARLALRHAFVPWEDGGLGLRRVHAFAAEANTGSRRVLEASGMTSTGRTRAEVLLGDGSWCDGTLYDVLADSWTGPEAATTS